MIEKATPRIGFVAMAMPGLFMGEEMCPQKREEGLRALTARGYAVHAAPCVYSPEEARTAGAALAAEDVDCLCVLLTTFVADYFLTELLKGCDRPVFIWALDRELFCITMVCTPLISASLKNLDKDCCVVAGELDDDYAWARLYTYSRAAMLANRLRQARIGYSGHKPLSMYSMEANEYLLDKRLGVSVVNMPIEDFYRMAETIDEAEVQERWAALKPTLGVCDIREEDALLSMRYYLAARKQVAEKGLNAYSLNCYPHLKARICLGIGMLNDEGIGAGCEGDLHATILMWALEQLTGEAAFNGDFMQLYPQKNAVMFSHCGAGALTLAGGCQNICLRKSAETEDGVGVFYPTCMPGEVTLVNLMNGPDALRLSVMCAQSIEDTSGYEGNPLMLRFEGDVRQMPDILAQSGAGHHWVGLRGDWQELLRLFARMTGLTYAFLQPEK